MGRKRKAEKQKEKEDDDGEFIVEYIVQAIPDSAESDDGWSYNVHWYGYSDDQNTWEPSSNLVGCERLVKSFWNQFPEHKRYKDQEAAISAQEWIQKEIQYCARNVKKKYNAKKPRLDVAHLPRRLRQRQPLNSLRA
ncbi:hypothetical protein BKA62DRAFT_496100 [Auriculariales sp. MPI-PUGE-AT-0066]|nr:hypothetical protein BKA62DRAFT_496100 [Auriculariales sp. MPI-PUGE-AT-0066]